MRLLLKQGHLIDPGSAFSGIGDLAISNGEILGFNLPDFEASQILDCTGKIIIPQPIDLKSKAINPSSVSTTGVQTLSNTVIPSVLDKTGQLIDLYKALKKGALGFRLELESLPQLNPKRLVELYTLLSTYNTTLFVTPFEASFMDMGLIHEGLISSRLGIPGIPVLAESIALAQHLLLVESFGLKTHFHCISSAAGINLIRKAKQAGLAITADTAIHYLHLNETHLANFDPYALVLPPLRSFDDQIALKAAILDGTLDAICSDHDAQKIEHKRCTLAEAKPGIANHQSFLGLFLKAFQDLSLNSQALKALTTNPARILGLAPKTATLAAGAPADLLIIDLNQTQTLNEAPFQNWQVNAKLCQILEKGIIINA